jgi:ATPase subunit of ABC transporter with duplicated ATPase domains
MMLLWAIFVLKFKDLLGAFMFGGDSWTKKVKVLSEESVPA